MKRSKIFIIIFFVILAAGFISLYLIKKGLYPVIIINSEIVWGYNLHKEAKAAEHYYKQTLAVYEKEEAKETNYNQIIVSVLENIIEKRLVSEALRQEMSDSELIASIHDTVAPYLAKPNLEQATLALYGLNLADFYELVIFPQAEKELWEKQLEKDGMDYSDWLSQAKKSSKIILLTKEF